jgi:hypothetical protein
MFIVLVALAAGVLVVASLLALMFVDVAFRRSQPAGLSPGDVANWHPPLVVGKKLSDWASSVAEFRATRKLQDGRKTTAAHELVGDLHEGAAEAIDQTWQQVDSRAKVGCPSYFHSMIAVTPPEAIRTAEYLLRFHAEQIGAVREQALQNLGETQGMDHNQYRAAAMRCPLMGADSSCLTYAVRPLRCRGGCDLSTDSTCTLGGDGSSATPPAVDTREFESRGRLVTEGAERGFSRALKSAGLDGDLYDLNGALIAALDTPHASERWVQGERIFDNCRHYE